MRAAAVTCAVAGVLVTAGYLAVQTFNSRIRLSIVGYLPAVVGLLIGTAIAIRRAYLLTAESDRPRFRAELRRALIGCGVVAIPWAAVVWFWGAGMWLLGAIIALAVSFLPNASSSWTRVTYLVYPGGRREIVKVEGSHATPPPSEAFLRVLATLLFGVLFWTAASFVVWYVVDISGATW